jgi:hypothetical protein
MVAGVSLFDTARAAASAALTAATSVLLGRSAYQPPDDATAHHGVQESDVEAMRESMGGQIAPMPTSQTRWYLSDLEYATHAADGGDLAPAARLMRAARSDGRLSGVLSTRTAGLVRLPKVFYGDPEIVTALEVGHTDRAGDTRSVFDEMFPPSELALLAADGVLCGVGVAELVPVIGREYPVMIRLDPEYLTYTWHENRWYFKSIAGPIPITPGDGRWILHTPGGRMSPWHHGLWRSIGRAYIRKDHAQLCKDNYEAKLANPARVAVSPQGGSEEQKQEWFRRVMAWGVNSVFSLTPGYDIKLIESNGRGWEAFDTTIAECNTDMVIAIAGQTVTTGDDMTGFVNADVHKTIRSDLIKSTADDLAHTINTQGIPAFVAQVFDPDEVATKVCVVQWDVTPPKDRNAEATALVTTATAITQLGTALDEHDKELDVEAMCDRFGVPTQPPKPEVGVEAAPPAAALNGAQVDSLVTVINQVALGQLPRDSAVVIIQVAFNVDPVTADRMLGSAGRGFVPAGVPVDAPLDPADAVDPDAPPDAPAPGDAPDPDADAPDPDEYEVAA